MNNYENNHHDGVTPISPILDESIEANLNNDNITDSELNEIADKTMEIFGSEFNVEPIHTSVINDSEFNTDTTVRDTIANDCVDSLNISNNNLDNTIISVVEYLKYLIVFNIPIFNLIMIIKLINIKDNTNNIHNLARAYLIFLIIISILLIIVKMF